MHSKTTLSLTAAMALAAVSLASVPVSAQVASKKSLTLDGARRVIAAAQAEAKRRHTTGVIAVVDDGGNLIALERLDGTFAAGARVSIGKARTAVQFQRPTAFFEDIIKKGRTPMVALDDFTPLQGGVPIAIDGQVVGGVGVSGAASAKEDEELALVGAAAVARAARAVSYWSGDQVAGAFARGAVLFEGGRNYMVHTSRRDAAGMAEVHEQDTDIIHVQGGSASFVTGGRLVGGVQTAPGELRGARIAGGQRRRIRKGDVLIVPSGTPHWFEDVRGPLTYYVVKVR